MVVLGGVYIYGGSGSILGSGNIHIYFGDAFFGLGLSNVPGVGILSLPDCFNLKYWFPFLYSNPKEKNE
ncbi:MAG: hypothetical protein CM15mP70_01460 [Pelagibacteraceae bacterium]|nr:MAG: hypothetical protein CM15mP70_01460 [Pelagibacteraceae bacterium]